MKKIVNLIRAVFILILLFSCDSNTNLEEKKVVTNPNGDSELALAMRTIFNQTEDIKSSLNKGSLVLPDDYIANLKSFHTATPTDPEVQVEQFYGFVNAIDIAAQKLEQSSNIEEQNEYYKSLVNTCVQCHQQFCPGPIRRINKLKISLAK